MTIEDVKAKDAAAQRALRQDAKRYRFLRELPHVQAQAYFWTYTSRKERDKAIDRDMIAWLSGTEERT